MILRLREAWLVLLLLIIAALLLPSSLLLSRTLYPSEHMKKTSEVSQNRYKEDQYLMRKALLKLDELDHEMSEMESDIPFLKHWLARP